MAAPGVILRFRELTPGIDTIEAHRELLHDGYVWWGWWKKEGERDCPEEIDRLANRARSGGIVAILVDTSAERLHEADVADVAVELPAGEHTRVPEYYRDRGKVAAWFRITSLRTDLPYDAQIEEMIGQSTIAFP